MRGILLVIVFLLWLAAVSQLVLPPAREPARSCVVIGEWRVCWEKVRR